MRLLIVEDEEDMREALCYGLRRRGYAVDAAGDGADAVEQCGINEYDLVVLDLNLPGLDGMEVLKHIRSMENPADSLCPLGACRQDQRAGQRSQRLSHQAVSF